MLPLLYNNSRQMPRLPVKKGKNLPLRSFPIAFSAVPMYDKTTSQRKGGHPLSYHFFPMIARMRYINRWGLMRNIQTENIQ